MTIINIELDKKNEIFLKKQGNLNKLSISENLLYLDKNKTKKHEIKKDIIEMFQELNSVKKGKIKTNSINNLFNA